MFLAGESVPQYPLRPEIGLVHTDIQREINRVLHMPPEHESVMWHESDYAEISALVYTSETSSPSSTASTNFSSFSCRAGSLISVICLGM